MDLELGNQFLPLDLTDKTNYENDFLSTQPDQPRLSKRESRMKDQMALGFELGKSLSIRLFHQNHGFVSF